MESGTSGSIQSSSGGDEEYDSRSKPMSTSAFFIPSHNVHPPIGTHHHLPPPLPPVAPPSTSLFDPFTNYLDTFSRSSPPVVPNLDMMWVRSAPSPPPPPPATVPLNMGSSSSSPAASGGGGSFPTTSGPAPRNPKKRSRASRRAPTTVLATDTSNFRAMVQEFTGIPAPPFAAGPPFSRSRLDLFGNAAAISSTPPYLLRPSAHKVHYPSFFPSSSVLDHVLSTSSTSSSSTSTTSPINFMATSNLPDLRSATIASSTSSNAYQILAPPTNNINISRQHQNQLDDSQQLFPFQSLLQPLPPSPPKYPSSNYLSIPGLEKQPQAGSAGSSWKTGSLLVSNMQSADQGRESSTSPLIRNEEGTRGNWSETGVLGGGDGGSMRQYNGSGSTKMNLSSSSSDFHAEKGPENVSSTRGEGMVDSWICSSDQ